MLRTGNEFFCAICKKKITLVEEPKTLVSRVQDLYREKVMEEWAVIPRLPKVLCVIPARLESTRLPKKVLLAETGKPLIQYAWEAAKAALLVDDVLIASDSEDVLAACSAFGAEAEATGPAESGTDRIASLLSWLESDAEIVVNLQADEPEITGEDIDQLIRGMIDHPQADMATMAYRYRDLLELMDRNSVKVTKTQSGRAIYFSREPIASEIHAGIYAYRRDFLLRFAATPQSPLEISENLEQLRALEMGAYCQVETLSHPTRGIDTAWDYREFCASRLRTCP